MNAAYKIQPQIDAGIRKKAGQRGIGREAGQKVDQRKKDRQHGDAYSPAQALSHTVSSLKYGLQ